jgi:glycosyltransferase involved in cell wall biosynthesis
MAREAFNAFQDTRTLNISIVIPCYNEEVNIVDTIAMVTAGIDDSIAEYEIILVDDGSSDNSREVIRSLMERDNRVRAVFHPENRGKGAALRSGFALARMEWVLMMDADLQIDIAELRNFLPLCTEYDIIAGFRIGRNESFGRALVSRTYNLLTSLVTGAGIRDVGCPFKLLKTNLVNDMPLTTEGFAIDPEILLFSKRYDYRIKEVGVCCRQRMKGRSTVKFRHLVKTLYELCLLKK